MSALGFAGGLAQAQEACIVCAGPAASYRCSIKDSDKAPAFRGSDKVLQFVCVTELAKMGGHESCRVNRDFGTMCIGDPRQLDVTKIGTQPEGAAAAAGTPQVPAKQASDGPPKTLEELARRTVATSKDGLSAAEESAKKAGDSVGGAVKKTWNCLASLFTSC